jgi:hypothetical protein
MEIIERYITNNPISTEYTYTYTPESLEKDLVVYSESMERSDEDGWFYDDEEDD